MPGRIKVIIDKDPVQEALVKSLQKRLSFLESLLKKNKGKESDIKSLRKLIAQMQQTSSKDSRLSALERKSDNLLEAIKQQKTKFSLQVIPSPS